MAESQRVAKAQLQELDANFENPINQDRWVTVQFNPENLKVSFANQIATPSGGAGDQRGSAGRQFVGAGTTKLALQIWFDVSALADTTNRDDQGNPVDDVRRLTQKVAYFITPTAQGNQFVPPAVRFIWGSFQFDGLMDSLDESLEFWSSEGKPLRASMSLNMSQQKIQQFVFRDTGSPPGGGGGATPGTRPLTPAPAGANLPSLADASGAGADWQSIAAANNIENPRLLATGQLIDLNPPSVSISGGASAQLTAGTSIGGSVGGSIGGSIG